MIYSKLAQFYDMFVDHNLTDKYVEIVKKHFSKGIVLDLGCGTGPLSIELAKAGFTVTASDISESMLEVAFNNSMRENVKINFFNHNILDPLNIDSDIITMSSDVINYLDNKAQMIQVFKHIYEIMSNDSVLIFDFLKTDYLVNLIGYHEEISLENETIIWDVFKNGEEFKIKHIISIGNITETHTQTTFKEEEYIKMCKSIKIIVVEKIQLDDRVIFVCKKDLC